MKYDAMQSYLWFHKMMQLLSADKNKELENGLEPFGLNSRTGTHYWNRRRKQTPYKESASCASDTFYWCF